LQTDALPYPPAYYTSLQDGNVGHAVTDAAWWSACPISRYVELEQCGHTPIGEVLDAFDFDPTVNYDVRSIPFALIGNHIQFALEAPNVIWLEFRPQPSVFTARPWDEGEAYVPGDIRFVVQDGDCYRARTAVCGDYPPLSQTWDLVPMPQILSQYAEQGGYIGALKEDGQGDKAQLQRAEADDLLDDAMARVVHLQNQSARWGREIRHRPAHI
jgi:hypothetical protein